MKRLLTHATLALFPLVAVVSFAIGIAFPKPGLSQADHAHHGASAPAAQPAMVDGTITNVDASGGNVTIRHGPIKKLGMDEGMTMVFRAKDPAMLKTVKAGDKVKFDADRVNGQFTVTKIEKAK